MDPGRLDPIGGIWGAELTVVGRLRILEQESDGEQGGELRQIGRARARGGNRAIPRGLSPLLNTLEKS